MSGSVCLWTTAACAEQVTARLLAPNQRLKLRLIVARVRRAAQRVQVLQAQDGGTDGTVLAQLDHTSTPMGKRLLRLWVSRPLRDVGAIGARQDAVQELMEAAMPAMDAAVACLHKVGDVERAVARLAGVPAACGLLVLRGLARGWVLTAHGSL